MSPNEGGPGTFKAIVGLHALAYISKSLTKMYQAEAETHTAVSHEFGPHLRDIDVTPSTMKGK